MKISRGLRNKNPLNIRRNSTKWKGLAAQQSDKEFFCFEEMCWGYRAAFVTLRNYFKRHGIATLGGWVSRWAPPQENDTAAYIAFVERKSGIGADERPDIWDKTTMCSIVAAMSWFENGTPASLADVEQGWALSLA